MCSSIHGLWSAPASAFDGSLFSGLADDLSPGEWWEEIGNPAGLEPYDVSSQAARQVLAVYSDYSQMGLSPLKASRASSTEDDLIGLLTRFGPPWPVLGVTPRFRFAHQTTAPVRTISLPRLRREVMTLAELHALVEQPPVNRAELSADLLEHWDEVSREITVVSTFRPDRVEHEPVACSLRALLMMYIVGRWGHSATRICPVYQAEFETGSTSR